MKKDSFSVVQRTPQTKALPISTPDQVIDIQTAVNYYNNFYDTRIRDNASDLTRNVWFELTILENFVTRIYDTCNKKGIALTGLAFLFGADADKKRTVFIAPMTYDEKMGLERSFTLYNDKVVFLHGHLIDSYSTISNYKELSNKEESLILGEQGILSITDAVQLYNDYHDQKIAPIADQVDADTRIVYYRTGEFEHYLTYLNNCGKAYQMNITGINMVFSAYDKDASYGAYANHQILFFAPTATHNQHLAFSSFDAPMENLLDFSKTEWDTQPHTIKKSLVSSLFNHGSSGPPPYTWD
ncbi:MAG: hypothetical protein AAGB24_09170 [Bacteroidota bacterium]